MKRSTFSTSTQLGDQLLQLCDPGVLHLNARIALSERGLEFSYAPITPVHLPA